MRSFWDQCMDRERLFVTAFLNEHATMSMNGTVVCGLLRHTAPTLAQYCDLITGFYAPAGTSCALIVGGHKADLVPTLDVYFRYDGVTYVRHEIPYGAFNLLGSKYMSIQFQGASVYFSESWMLPQAERRILDKRWYRDDLRPNHRNEEFLHWLRANVNFLAKRNVTTETPREQF